ncbi:MAG: histidine phosphatase family protein [Dehalococcoidia bacterium]|nr:histidine phosphatase family protein [Dehalococcoidia bacterium]
MRLLLIRHGESSANAETRLQGHVDYELSERGRRESDLLAFRLASAQIDVLYSSPLSRARKTAEVIAARLGIGIELEPGLVERDVGELGGLTRDEIRARHPDYVKARTEGAPIVMIDGWESDEGMAERVERTIGTIIERHAGQTVAAVTHGGVITMFCRRMLAFPTVRPVPFSVSNASITTVDVAGGDFDPRLRARIQLVTLNDTCHLAGL